MPTNRVPLLGVAGLMMAAGVAATSGAVSAPATGSPVTAGSAQASSKIAFVSEPVGGGYCGTVYVMNADGSGQRRLTNGGVPGCGQEGVPVWSPDGRRIVVTGTPPGDPDPLSADSNIYVVNADGSGQRKLTGGTADGFVLGSPAWSPDGRKIVFAHCTPHACAGERDGLYIVNADGSGERRLTPSGHSPTWLPKGQKLAFMSGFNGNSEIYVVNADGSGQRRLTRNTMGYSHPVWSPDGRRIAFESNWQVWVMNADGSGKRKLTLKGAHNQNPAWSPTGRGSPSSAEDDGPSCPTSPGRRATRCMS